MSCCHYYADCDGGDSVFSVDISAIKFGHGVFHEVGQDAKSLGMKRVALMTDSTVLQQAFFQDILHACQKAGIDIEIFSDVRVEPSDTSFKEAIKFATEGNFDGFISVGGGSVIDTCKAANLYSTYPADFLDYVNAPIGAGKPVPGELKPHIACPTTSGTGSECTGIAVFDLESLHVKTGIANRALRPTKAIVDPVVTHSLPNLVTACSGFDVLSHALESLTAIPHSQRPAPATSLLRPMSQGANPWSDIGAREALRLAGKYLVRASQDANDIEAREQMMFAATLAGIAFGNAGVHIPHGMSYSVAGMVKDFQPDGYPNDHAMCPHGMSVIVNAPAAFLFTAEACPERHLEGAALLGADIGSAETNDAGPILSAHLMKMMQDTGMPNGVGGIGYNDKDVAELSAGAFAQQRLLKNSPKPVSETDLQSLYLDAMSYW